MEEVQKCESQAPDEWSKQVSMVEHEGFNTDYPSHYREKRVWSCNPAQQHSQLSSRSLNFLHIYFRPASQNNRHQVSLESDAKFTTWTTTKISRSRLQCRAFLHRFLPSRRNS